MAAGAAAAEGAEVLGPPVPVPAVEFDVGRPPKLRSEAEWPWRPTPAAPVASGAAACPAAGPVGVAAEGQPARPEDSTPVEEVFSFEQHLWDRFDFLWQSRCEPSLRLLEEVAEVLRSRAELERRYGESLRGFGPNIQLNPQENSVHVAVDAVLVNFRNRGEQSLELAEEIEHDIVATLGAVAKQHREVSKRIFSDMALLHRYCENWRHQHEKLAKRYGSRCSEAEGAAQDCLQGVGMKTADRLKAGIRATTLSKQARVSEHEYYASIEQANRAQHLFEQQLPVMLRALQEMDEKRARCLKDGLMKLAVYETSWLRNLQYDLEATVQASEGADPYTDLQDFIRQHRSQKVRQEAKTQLVAQPFFLLGKCKTPAGPSKVQFEACATVRQIAEDEYWPFVHGLIADDPAADSSDKAKEKLDHLRQGLGDPRRRAAVCQALRREVLSQQPQGAELENSKSVAVAPAAFEVVVTLFKACLDACHEQNDAWCGRDLMVLSQLFRAEGERPAQLLTRVYNHALWNKVTFWEDVLLLGLCEAHAAESAWRRNLPAGSQFSQPSMTAFLERFVGYMMAFGISFDQGRSSVSATLRKHANVLGSTGKAYAALLLQRYEEASTPAAAASGAAAPAARMLEEDAAASPATPASAGGEVSSTSADAGAASAFGAGAGSVEPALSDSPVAAAEADGDACDEGEMDDFEAVALGVQATFPEDDDGGQAAVREAVTTALDDQAADPAASPSGTEDSSAEADQSQKDGDSPFKVMAKTQRSVSDVFG
mmetsp:Transcript_34147/g.107005  ORF Transcript_34147/g.107005 Transcript_34147/m.107005 type:complete len:771 (+) Transcript_34147:3-2315(+)